MDDLEATKDMVDLLAASTGVLSLASYLPPLASLFTIIWLGLRIFESPTVQRLIGRRKK
jgi:hypothetical protein